MSSGMTEEEGKTLDTLYRAQVKGGDAAIEEIENTINQIKILKALVEHNENKAPDGPRQRNNISRDTPSSRIEIDSAVDSPAPSPMADKPRKDRTGSSRSSLPPKDVPVKQESAEATSNSGMGGAEVNAKGKIYFTLGAVVAFRPKPSPGNEEPDWIQGEVVKIIGEGKSRRYDVQDPEPDEITRKPGQIYRTSASSMVPIPSLGAPLGDYPAGKTVLARYPDTTTFYRAEVVRMDGSNVVLRFDGEDEKEKTLEVDRRFVLDHKG